MHLLKNPPLAIDSSAPFNDDILGHKSDIELLTVMLKSANQGFVMTVESPWGLGKTTFIKRWRAYLQSLGHTCLYFNAWENDFVSDPLVALVGELRPIVEALQAGSDTSAPLRKQWNRLKYIAGQLTRKSAPILIKGVAHQILGAEAVKDFSEAASKSLDEVADAISDSVKKQIEEYEEAKNSIRYFRDSLGDLAKQIGEVAGKPPQIIFFIDELDRCRPDFAMTLIERVKHLFEVENVIFVLAIDREQLRNTVRLLYGSGKHADVYLRRFIDVGYKLPIPTGSAFSDFLTTRFRLGEMFQERKDGAICLDRLRRTFADVADWLRLDLRTQERCFTRMRAIASLWPAEQFLPGDALAVLVGVRVGESEWYDALAAGHSTPEERLPEARSSDDELPLLIETTLAAVFTPDGVYREKANSEFEKKRQAGPMSLGRDRANDIFVYLAHHRHQLRRLIDFSATLK